MAQVAHILTSQQRIDPYLDYLYREWRSIPERVREWQEWEEHDKLDFVVEWPLREDYLHQLRRWREQGILSPAQCARYDELLEVVAQYRPVVEQLFNDHA